MLPTPSFSCHICLHCFLVAAASRPPAPRPHPPRTHPYPTPAAIDEVRTRGESCGGEVTCVVRGCPKGLGSPVFDKLEAELARAVMSLPATKVRGWVGPTAAVGGEGFHTLPPCTFADASHLQLCVHSPRVTSPACLPPVPADSLAALLRRALRLAAGSAGPA